MNPNPRCSSPCTGSKRTPTSLPPLPSSTAALPPIKKTRQVYNQKLPQVKPGFGASSLAERRKAKRPFPLQKPSSLEDIIVHSSPKLNKREKEKRNKNLIILPERSGSLPGLVTPNEPRPNSDDSSRRGRQRKREGRLQRRGMSLERLQDRKRGNQTYQRNYSDIKNTSFKVGFSLNY
ncbi:hypothetical protein Avbf_09960 [Armadillidium vulgare]|nr:hypothetical protein Avbf_09960 [Armadillidium vulgare]